MKKEHTDEKQTVGTLPECRSFLSAACSAPPAPENPSSSPEGDVTYALYQGTKDSDLSDEEQAAANRLLLSDRPEGTLAQLSDVTSFQVSIAADEESAEVTIEVGPGKALDPQQLTTVKQLVAAAVAGMSEDAVTVTTTAASD